MATIGALQETMDSKITKKNTLEILSEMQHYGSGTILIDFTSEILNALFFAFKNDNFSPTKSIKEEYKGHITIFMKSISNHKNGIEDDIKNDIDLNDLDANNRKLNIIYSCPKNINRGISQKSYFIVDNNELTLEEKQINISFPLKEKVIKFLESKMINNENIYPDVEGVYMNFSEKNISMIFIKGNSLLNLKRYEEAIEKYGEAIRINPNYANAYCNWGIALSRLERYGEAIEKYGEAIRIDSKYTIAYSNWGNALIELGRYEDAIEKFVKTIETMPKQAKIHNNYDLLKHKQNEAGVYHSWGFALFELEKYGEAIEKYEEAIRINPDYADAYFSCGIALIKLGKCEDANEIYEKLLETIPKQAVVNKSKRLALSKLERCEEIKEKYENLKKMVRKPISHK